MRFSPCKHILIMLAIVLAGGQLCAQSWSTSSGSPSEKLSEYEASSSQMVYSSSLQLYQSMSMAMPNELAIPDEDSRLVQLADWLVLGGGGQTQAIGGGVDDFESGADQQYPFAPLTSLSEVAELFDPPDHTTKLFLNFEGKTAQWDHVMAFEATTDDRERDIQEIMFYVSQTFAPFNVSVQRFVGNSQQAESSGHTTIFIGDKLSNSVYMESDSGHSLTNYKRAYADGDFPCLNRSVTHQPNSDDFNIGYVDPVSHKTANGVTIEAWDTNENDAIARSINHEAGHTFGLAHVLSGSVSDIMSYSAMNQRAHYQEFDLSALNSQLGGPTTEDIGWAAAWTYEQVVGFGETQLVAHQLETQNSYRVLESTLGTRSVANDVSNIANFDLVHGVYPDAMALSIFAGQMIPSAISHLGDYDVFDFSPDTTDFIEVNAVAWNDPVWFDPILMVFNEQGDELIAYDRSSGDGKDAKLVFQAVLGESYKIVVGSYSCNTFGDYQLSVDSAEFKVNPGILPVGGMKATNNPTHDDLGEIKNARTLLRTGSR
ncbi:MAG: hypothetical protein ACR2NP_15355 [Pirellulaceae bacterium]